MSEAIAGPAPGRQQPGSTPVVTVVGFLLVALLFLVLPLSASWAIETSCGQPVAVWTLCCSLVVVGFGASAILHADDKRPHHQPGPAPSPAPPAPPGEGSAMP